MTQLDLFQLPIESTLDPSRLLPPLLALVVELESLAEHILDRPYLGQASREVAITRQAVARRLRDIIARAAA